MKKIKYQIEFFSHWHIGSGLSVAGDVDMAVLKDKNHLPYIPGKTLKGLLRHAAETIHIFQKELITNQFIEEVFGKKTGPEDNEESAGHCFFSNAYLSTNLQNHIDRDQSSYCYQKIASTAICVKKGVAKDTSLRKMEVTIPLVLLAEVAEVKTIWEPQFEIIMKMVKRIGLARHRGLGRCEFSILT